MTGNGVLQIAFYTVVLIVLAYPLGIYMARIYNAPIASFGRLGAVERGFLRLVGSKPDDEQDWKGYGITALIFTGVFVVFLYLMLRIQGGLPLNPDDLPGVSAPIALNTAASFVTNTNWQYYGGEYTMSYLTQMAGLAVQNFVSAAAGMAILAAVVRGFARRSTREIGLFWRDLYRSLVYILLPLAVVLAIVLISQGVPQTFDGHATAHTVEGATQTIARGPVASQIAIKQLGTNGGGFYNSNSSVPFENPNGLTNFLEMLAILLIPAAQVFMFGRMVGSMRQASAILAAMVVLMLVGVAIAYPTEQHGSQVLRDSGVNLTASADQSGGNMSDKEVRFGIANTALWATVTTDASNGSVNGGHDAFTPIGGSVPLVNIFFGEVVFGGVGSGLYGMFFYVLIAVFVAGLMVGRTPEYLGKKIEAREIKYAALGALFVPSMALVLTGISVATDGGLASIYNPAAHGFTEALYAYTSQSNNNGSAFAGYGALPVLGQPGQRGALPRTVRPDVRGARPRRRVGREEDDTGFRGHVPHRRRDVHLPAGGDHHPHRRPHDLPGAHAGPNRGGALMIRIALRSVLAMLVLTVVFGLVYPAVMTGFAQLAFSSKAQGSLVTRDGRVIGSSLAAQKFTGKQYFHVRPSATVPPYNAGATTFANLGPTNPALAKAVKANIASVLKLEGPYNPGLTAAGIPVDAVTTSGSGIDPDITPAYADLQAKRVASRSRHLAGRGRQD